MRGEPGLALLFAAGERPEAGDIDRLLQSSTVGGMAATVGHRPDGDAGWLELVSSGLTFDLSGLAPGVPASPPPARYFFGLPEQTDAFGFEAVTLAPGPHVAAGAGIIPLVRVMMGLALLLVQARGVKAVCWHPVGSWMASGYFSRLMADWLSGGAFPALGLTAIKHTPDGGVESDGLGFFLGQELRVEPSERELATDRVKLAVRAIDYLVRQGALSERQELKGLDGEAMIAEPSPDGRRVRLWRGT